MKHLSLDSSVATRLKFRMKRTEDRLEMGPVIGILAKVTAHEQPRTGTMATKSSTLFGM